MTQKRSSLPESADTSDGIASPSAHADHLEAAGVAWRAFEAPDDAARGGPRAP